MSDNAKPLGSGSNNTGSKSIWTTLNKGFDNLLDGLFVMACVLIAYIVLAVVVDVAMRTFLNSPQVWSGETVAYSVVYIWLGATGYASRKNKHVRMDVVFMWMKGTKGKQILTMTVFALSVAVLLFVAVGSAVSVWETLVGGKTTMTILAVPQWIIVLPIPFGCLILAIDYIRKLAYLVRNPDIYVETDYGM